MSDATASASTATAEFDEELFKEIVEDYDNDANAVQVVVLDNKKLKNGVPASVLQRFPNLTKLTLNFCNLKSLDGFPSLPSLKKLELNDNKIKDGLQALANANLENLHFLSLAGNKVSKITYLEPLKSIASLRYLELEGCPIAENDDHRGKVFALLPQLVSVDGEDKDRNELEYQSEDEEEEDEGEDDEEEIKKLWGGAGDEEGEEGGGDDAGGETSGTAGTRRSLEQVEGAEEKDEGEPPQKKTKTDDA